jgi:hypothetical protein
MHSPTSLLRLYRGTTRIIIYNKIGLEYRHNKIPINVGRCFSSKRNWVWRDDSNENTDGVSSPIRLVLKILPNHVGTRSFSQDPSLMRKETSSSSSTPLESPKKLTLWEKTKHECKRYWIGSKLLWADMKISTRLARRLARGETLTRREHQQLQRTTGDMFRLLPFSFFVIVPFAEFSLPIFLKLFPRMLPSTFEDDLQRVNVVPNRRCEKCRRREEIVERMCLELATVLAFLLLGFPW